MDGRWRTAIINALIIVLKTVFTNLAWMAYTYTVIKRYSSIRASSRAAAAKRAGLPEENMPAEKISEAEAPGALPPRTKYQKSSSSTAPAAVTIRWMAVDCTRLSLNAFKKLLYICDSLSSAILRVI